MKKLDGEAKTAARREWRSCWRKHCGSILRLENWKAQEVQCVSVTGPSNPWPSLGYFPWGESTKGLNISIYQNAEARAHGSREGEKGGEDNQVFKPDRTHGCVGGSGPWLWIRMGLSGPELKTTGQWNNGEIGRRWPVGQSWPSICFCKWSCIGTLPCSIVYISSVSAFEQSWVVATETLCPTKSKIFIIYPCTEKICQWHKGHWAWGSKNLGSVLVYLYPYLVT